MAQEWNYIKAIANPLAAGIIKDSEEEFITDHYWGYTFVSNDCTGEYEVSHPKWNIHTVNSYDIKCNVKELYSADFVSALARKPTSVFLADGSTITIMKGSKIYQDKLRPLQSKSNPQYVNEGKRGLIFADKGRAKNQ